MPMRLPVFILLTLTLPTLSFADISFNPQLAKSLVKIIGSSQGGKIHLGSGVIVARGLVATNCHVTQMAQSIFVYKMDTRYPVVLQSVNAELDICILYVAHLDLPSVKIGSAASIQTGDKVITYGYPYASSLTYRNGIVSNLYNFHSAKVIEISITIKQGASGGGLFNEQGQLIGLTTFYKEQDGGHYFAIPIDWVLDAATTNFTKVAPFPGIPFWRNAFFPANKP